MASTPEAKVKKQIREVLQQYGAVYAMPIGTGYGVSGVSDFLVCHCGVFIAIEAKAGTNKPTALQERFMKQVRDAGGYALVINENNLVVLTKLLQTIKEMS